VADTQVLVADDKELRVRVFKAILCPVRLLLLCFTWLGICGVVVRPEVSTEVPLHLITEEVRISILKSEVIQTHRPLRVTLVD